MSSPFDFFLLVFGFFTASGAAWACSDSETDSYDE